MKIFESDGKINFVDTNDVYIGFDAWQSCCEHFGYGFLNKIPEQMADGFYDHEADTKPDNLESMVFDTDFFQEYPYNDGGGYAVFRLVAPQFARQQTDTKKRQVEREFAANNFLVECYLVLFNHHNGYYGHGFEVKHGGELVQTGGL